jgi:hypothetical protein
MSRLDEKLRRHLDGRLDEDLDEHLNEHLNKNRDKRLSETQTFPKQLMLPKSGPEHSTKEPLKTERP